MRNAKTSVIDIDEFRIPETSNFIVGRIVRITGDGRAFIDYPGNPRGPLEARSIIQTTSRDKDIGEVDIPVLLMFENGEYTLPIIVGIIKNTLYQNDSSKETTFSKNQPKDILLGVKKMVFEAKEEIELRCGKSSVILKKDGKIVLKGVDVVSRASRTNKIKGASVKIN